MVLAITDRFKKTILKRIQSFAICADVCDRWKAGRVIHFATGVGTKNYKQFYERVCVRTQRIEIIPSERVDKIVVKVDGIALSLEDIAHLAHKGGFLCALDFFAWFRDGFTGKIIHWTGLRY